MFKFLVIVLLTFSYSGTTIIKSPVAIPDQFLDSQLQVSNVELNPEWLPHLMDFLKLVDIEKVMMTAIQYLDDPEVLRFLGFMLSPKFKELLWEIQMMAEFKEALSYLSEKGYDVESILEYINAALNLRPKQYQTISKQHFKGEKGIFGLIKAMMEVLPLEDMKRLFEEKLKVIPELAELVENLKSEEFKDILEIMSKNPKLKEFKSVLEEHGFDIKLICTLIKEKFDEDYQGIVCE